MSFLKETKPQIDLSVGLEQAYPSMYLYEKRITPKVVISEKFSGPRQDKEMHRKGYVHLLADRKRENGGEAILYHCKEFLLENHFDIFKKITSSV